MKTIVEDKYIVFLVFSGVVGLFTNLPKEYATYVGTGGWVVIIIDLLLILPPSLAIVWLNKEYEGKIVPEYVVDILGKYIAFPINILYFIRFFMLIPLMTRALLGMVKATVLELTPFWPLAFVFIACASYAASRGIKSLAYICQFFVLIALILSCMLFFAMFTKGRFINLRPFFVKEDIPLYFKESIRNLRIYFGAGILLVTPLSKKNNKKAVKYLLLGFLTITLFYLAVFWSTIIVKNVNDAVLYDDVFFIAVRSVEIENLEILKRLDGLAITTFIFTSLMMLATNLYGATMTIKYYLDKNDSFKNLSLNAYCMILSLIGFILCIIIPNAFVVSKYLKVTYIIAWFTSLIIPILLFIVVKVKRKIKGSKQMESSQQN